MKRFTIIMIGVLMAGVTHAETLWGPTVLSEPDTVLPKIWPDAAVNHYGEYMVIWQDCRDGGWPWDGQWFNMYGGKVGYNGERQGPNQLLEPPGWDTFTSILPEVVYFDDGSFWVAVPWSYKAFGIFFYDENGTAVDSVQIPYVQTLMRYWDWEKTGEGEAVLVNAVDPGELEGLYIRYITLGKVADSFRLGTFPGANPQIDMNEAQDRLLVGYEEPRSQPHNETGIYWLYYDLETDSVTEPVYVDTGTVKEIIWGPNDQVMVTWTRGYIPYYRLYNVYGAHLTQPLLLEWAFCGNGPAATACPQGYLVSWQSEDMNVIILNTEGEVINPSVEITEHPGQVGWCWSDDYDGGYTVMWLQDNHLYGRRLTYTGIQATEPYLISDDDTGSLVGWSEVALAPDGSGFALYSTHDNGRYFDGVNLRHFYGNGGHEYLWHHEDVQAGPSLSIAPDGGAWLSYIEKEPFTGKEHVCVQRFNKHGIPAGDEIEVVVGDWGHRSPNTAVAVRDDGLGVVVWPQYGGIWGRFVASNGSLRGAPFQIMEDQGIRYGLDVHYFDDGGFVVTAQDYVVATRLFDEDGAPQTDKFLSDTVWGPNDGYSIATNGERFVVAWNWYGINGYGAQVFDRQGNRIGAPIGEEVPMEPEHWIRNARHFAPAVAMDESGDWVVAWTEIDQATGKLGIKCRMYDADGNRIGDEFCPIDGFSSDGFSSDGFSSFETFQGSNSLDASDGRLLYTWYGSNRHLGRELYGSLVNWPIPPGVDEEPQNPNPDNWCVEVPIGPVISIEFTNCPGGFHAYAYNIAGEKVDELRAVTSSGNLTWGTDAPPGVYFIRPVSQTMGRSQRVLIIR